MNFRFEFLCQFRPKLWRNRGQMITMIIVDKKAQEEAIADAASLAVPANPAGRKDETLGSSLKHPPIFPMLDKAKIMEEINQAKACQQVLTFGSQ